MGENDAQIDILFRNKLKKMEVLPPSDLWDDISGAVHKPRSGVILFRTAAAVAAIVTISFLTYFAGTRNGDLQRSPVTASLDGQPVVTGRGTIAEPDIRQVSNKTLPVNDESITASERATELLSYQGVEETEGLTTTPKTTNVLNIESTGARSRTLGRTNNHMTAKAIEPESMIAKNESPLLMPATESIIKSRWKVGARMSPTYLAPTLAAANSSITDLSSDESAVMSYSGGVAFVFNMTDRLSVQTGVYYSSLGREISGINSYSGFSPFAGTKSGVVFGVETTTGTISSTNRDIFLNDAAASRISGQYTPDNFDPVKANLVPFGTKLRQSYEYVEIPVMFSYKVIDRRIDFNILGGMSTNFLLNNRTFAVGETDGSKILIGTTSDQKGILLSSDLGMSMEYNLTKKISLNLEPSFKYYLNTGGSFTFTNPYSLGLYSGFTYKF